MSYLRTDSAPQGVDGPELALPVGPVAKICGLTRVEDVLRAVEAGAWAVGFVFAPSVRRVTVEQVDALLSQAGQAATGMGAHGPLTVGVFGDMSATEIAGIVRSAGLDAVQLHGEAGARPDEVRRALDGLRPSLRLSARGSSGLESVLILRAVGVQAGGEDPGELERRIDTRAEGADLVLLDTRSGDRFGGTGVSFPWELARKCCGTTRFLIAGGIGPANVREAVLGSGAWGVDVSSGVEAKPGIKDARAIKDLITALNDLGPSGGGGRAGVPQEGSTT